jgi:CheY-like chemotaxis protein
MLQRIIGEHIKLDIGYHDEIGHIQADVGLIEQCIMNLVVNARDAMPDGGSMKIRIDTTMPGDEADLKSIDDLDQEMIRILVSDTGVGMRKGTLERIFEPFFTTKPLGKGTGLGLATVYGIVKQFGGHVAVQSKLDKGTTFKLFFPCIEGEPAVEPKQRSRNLFAGDETILLCEDEEIVRNLMSIILEKAGYNVLSAENASQAIQQAKNSKTGINLLVTDVVMPDMNGSKLADLLIEQHGSLPVLFVSGYTSETIDGLEHMASPADFLNKPFLPKELLERVRVLLDE